MSNELIAAQDLPIELQRDEWLEKPEQETSSTEESSEEQAETEKKEETEKKKPEETEKNKSVASAWERIKKAESKALRIQKEAEARAAEAEKLINEANEAREAMRLLKDNPMEFVDKFGHDKFYDELTQRRLNNNNPGEIELQRKIQEMAAKVAEEKLEEKRKAWEEEQAKKQQEHLLKQAEQIESDVISLIQSNEEYADLLELEGVTENNIYDAIADHYRKTNNLLTAQQALDIICGNIKEKHQKLLTKLEAKGAIQSAKDKQSANAQSKKATDSGEASQKTLTDDFASAFIPADFDSLPREEKKRIIAEALDRAEA